MSGQSLRYFLAGRPERKKEKQQQQVQVVLLDIRPLEFPLVYSMAVSLSSSGSCRYATYSDFLTDGTRLSLGPNRLMYRVILVV